MLPYSSDLEQYYIAQAGNGLSYYSGSPTQKGHGLGAIFRSLARVALPLVKRVGKKVAHEALTTGLSVGSDMLTGKKFKDSLKSRGKETASRVLSGKGRKRKRGINKRVNKKVIIQHKRKARTRDIFS